MNLFEIGEYVVALNTPSDPRSQPRKKGHVYQIKDISYCPRCNVQKINIGAAPPSYIDLITCACGCSYDNKGLHWTMSKYFAPIDEMVKDGVIEELVEITKPIIY